MQTTIRDAIIAFVKPAYDAEFPETPIEYPNSPFDWANLEKDFVCFSIEFDSGSQVGMSSNPKRRISGRIYVTAYSRVGTGTKVALRLMDWFSDLLKFQSLGGANLQAPSPKPPSTARGYYTEELLVSFYSDPA